MEGEDAAGDPRPSESAFGKFRGWVKGRYVSALPLLATVLAVCFFSFYYAETYMCSLSGWACPNAGYTGWAFACCDKEKPYFTDLFNSLQDQSGTGQGSSLCPLFSTAAAPCASPTPTASIASQSNSPNPSPTPGPTPNRFNPGPVEMAATYQGHVAWTLFAGLYVIACFVALGVGVWVIWDATGYGPRAKFLLVIAALAVGVAGAAPALKVLASYKQDIFTQLINNTVNRDIHNISWLEFGLDGVGLVLAVFLSVAGSVTLLRREDERLGARPLLAVQYNHLTLILYAGTVLLILATLRVNALLHWSLAFLQPAPWLPEAAGRNALFVYKGVEGLVSNLVTSVGAFGTLLLAAVYIPAALVLNWRAARLVPERPKVHAGAEPGLMGKGPGLVLPLPEQLLRIAVILGPFIAGPVGDWVSRLR